MRQNVLDYEFIVYIRAQLASSLLVVVGRDRLFGSVLYATEDYCGNELLRTIADYCVVAYYGRSFPNVKWFKAYCEFVSVATASLVSNREIT